MRMGENPLYVGESPQRWIVRRWKPLAVNRTMVKSPEVNAPDYTLFKTHRTPYQRLYLKPVDVANIYINQALNKGFGLSWGYLSDNSLNRNLCDKFFMSCNFTGSRNREKWIPDSVIANWSSYSSNWFYCRRMATMGYTWCYPKMSLQPVCHCTLEGRHCRPETENGAT